MANCIHLVLLVFGIITTFAETIEFCEEGVNIETLGLYRVCTVKNQDLVFDHGFIWSRSDITEVHFINSKLTCRTTMQTGCTITLELSRTD